MGRRGTKEITNQVWERVEQLDVPNYYHLSLTKKHEPNVSEYCLFDRISMLVNNNWLHVVPTLVSFWWYSLRLLKYVMVLFETDCHRIVPIQANLRTKKKKEKRKKKIVELIWKSFRSKLHHSQMLYWQQRYRVDWWIVNDILRECSHFTFSKRIIESYSCSVRLIGLFRETQFCLKLGFHQKQFSLLFWIFEMFQINSIEKIESCSVMTWQITIAFGLFFYSFQSFGYVDFWKLLYSRKKMNTKFNETLFTRNASMFYNRPRKFVISWKVTKKITVT